MCRSSGTGQDHGQEDGLPPHATFQSATNVTTFYADILSGLEEHLAAKEFKLNWAMWSSPKHSNQSVLRIVREAGLEGFLVIGDLIDPQLYRASAPQ